MVNYQLKCRDLGFDSCDYIATGNSESELMRKFFFHTMVLHDKDFQLLAKEKKIELHDLVTRILEDQN